MRRYLVLIAALALVLPIPASAGSNHSFSSRDYDCTDEAYEGEGTIHQDPRVLWPPNHKDTPVTFTYDHPEDGELLKLDIVKEFHTDVVGEGEGATERGGSGNTDYTTDSTSGSAVSDADGKTVTVAVSARRERSGQVKEGRTYFWEFTAWRDDNGDGQFSDDEIACQSTVVEEGAANSDDLYANVPHDCRNGGCKA